LWEGKREKNSGIPSASPSSNFLKGGQHNLAFLGGGTKSGGKRGDEKSLAKEKCLITSYTGKKA